MVMKDFVTAKERLSDVNIFRCVACGRFLSRKEIESENVIKGTDHAFDGEPLEDYFIHKKCEIN